MIKNNDKSDNLMQEYEYMVPNYPTCKKYENIQFKEKKYAIPRNMPFQEICHSKK